MSPPEDHILAAARRVSAVATEIAYATDPAELLDLRRRAGEMISGLPSALDRARLMEPVDDAANARLRELET